MTVTKYMITLYFFSDSCQTQFVVHLDVSLHPSLTFTLALVQPTSAGKAPLENPSREYGIR